VWPTSLSDEEDAAVVVRLLHIWTNGKRMAAAFSSTTAIARMAIEGTPVWDLATLMPDGAVGASASGGRAVVLAQEFAEEHRGRIGGYDAMELASLCADLERVQEALTVSHAYSMLHFDADGRPPGHGALLAESGELMARVETLVTFVEREWIALDDARAEELLADPALGRFAHWLRRVRHSRPYPLSEPEERILAEKTRPGPTSTAGPRTPRSPRSRRSSTRSPAV
jgi:oligoendopeptidase F